jgi:hypothetical protein
MEWQATTVPVEEELGLGWPLVYYPGWRHSPRAGPGGRVHELAVMVTVRGTVTLAVTVS